MQNILKALELKKELDSLRPLNKDQEAELANLDRTGSVVDRIPNIGNDIAYTFNLGLEFRF